MEVLFCDEEGNRLDAAGSIGEGGAVLYSRGGARGGPNVRNIDYARALRLILRRIADSGVDLGGVYVDSSRVRDLPMPDRLVLSTEELRRDPEGAFTRASGRIGRIGSRRATGGGNRNKRLLFSFATAEDPLQMADELGAVVVGSGAATDQPRLPASLLQQVRADHIWLAIRDLTSGAAHAFGDSTTYDLVTDDGLRLPPKAVFGLAATRALGFEVGPSRFSAGWSQPCFRILLEAGYRIEPKTGAPASEPAARVWREGELRQTLHARRERGRGLAAAKKAAFRRRHGRLWCERCGLDPVSTFGSEEGEACIEVHHAATAVRDMGADHTTVLEDLICLCANCHRYVHRALERT